MTRDSAIAEPTSREKLRCLAYQLRKKIGFEGEMEFPILQFLEMALVKLDPDFVLEVVAKEKMGDCHGKACPERHTIYIREDVYDGACARNGRDRFTIAHEIAHYFLHRPGHVSYARMSSTGRIPAYRNPEWQANTLAAELLMPADLIVGKTIEEVVRECAVSHTAADIQLSCLENTK